ncbi:hypothetical protein, partial [Klebsiella aerogenes]|uniref:hypothetical protein n=1 Tax=Klebsiella aerogenes TaxID=548 RepID=UPI001954D979
NTGSSIALAMGSGFKRCFRYNFPTLLVLMLGSSLVYFQLGGPEAAASGHPAAEPGGGDGARVSD